MIWTKKYQPQKTIDNSVRFAVALSGLTINKEDVPSHNHVNFSWEHLHDLNIFNVKYYETFTDLSCIYYHVFIVMKDDKFPAYFQRPIIEQMAQVEPHTLSREVY